MTYFFIKQKNGRKSAFRVYKTDFHRCELVRGFPSEESAKSLTNQLNKDEVLLVQKVR